MRAAPIALAIALVLLLLAAPARAAETVTESFRVPTVDGAKVYVEVTRPVGEKVPVILTYSPYNVLSAGSETQDTYGERYVPKGYARAVGDVLGTRNSSGCWDYGGPKESQSGVDLVNFLASQEWSNGRVGMIGGSYDGTTATMVAARGADAPGLASIVPIAAISRWYGYAYSHGIRYAGNSQRPTDEGADTPLGFDFGFGRVPPDDPAAIDAAADRIRPCDADLHTAKGYDTSPDYDGFWLERDYRKDAAKVRVPALVTHGWQDYNVKQEEAIELYDALPGAGAAFKRLYMFQGAHGSPAADGFLPALDAFFGKTLKGQDTGAERSPAAVTQTRDAAGAGKLESLAAWPPPTTGGVALSLGREEDAGTLGGSGSGGASYTDRAAGSEETAAKDPAAEAQWLAYATKPLTADARIAGSPELDLTLAADRDHGHLTPTLLDIGPGGAAVPITRGFLNLRYRGGLDAERPVPVGTPLRARVTFKPQDWTVRRGHRVALVIASSNTAWAVPDEPGLGVEVRGDGTSELRLPLVGAARAASGTGSAPDPSAPPAPTPAVRAIPGAVAVAPATAGRRTLTVALRRTGRRRSASRRTPVRLRAAGRAATGARVLVRLQRGGQTVLTRRVIARRGAFGVTFRVRRGGRYRVVASLRDAGGPLRGRSPVVRLR